MRQVSNFLRRGNSGSESSQTSPPPVGGTALPSPRSGDDPNRISRIFDSLSGSPDAASLGVGGIIALMEKEMNINPETDIEALVLLDAFGCQSILDISREEFITGMKKLQCRDLASLKQMLPMLTEARLKGADDFRRFYRGVYDKARAPGSKVVAKDLCCGLWPILLKTHPKRSVHVDKFVQYISSRDDVRFIGADLWTSFLNFSLQIDADMKNFDVGGAWPLLLDDFVAWAAANAA